MHEVLYNLGYGDEFRYTLLRYTEISSAKNVPGIYSWYMRTRLGTCDEWGKVNDVYNSRRLKTTVLGHLGERYDGTINKTPFPADAMRDSPVLNGAMAAFATPLYIGISKTIRTRLECHQKALNDFFISSTTLPENEDEITSDSEKESKYFAHRIGKSLVESGFNQASNLYLKVIYLEGIDEDDIFAAEKMLNRMIHPNYGRK